MTLLESLRSSRKNPSVLKLPVLKIRGEDPDALIFIYEGPEDIPVYEEWMSRIDACPKHESIAGSGKEQLLALHKLLKETQDPILNWVYFFCGSRF